MQDSRGGNDYDTEFGSGMRSTGPFADLTMQRLKKAIRRFGLDNRLAPLRTDLFHRPEVPSPQLPLI